MRTIVVVHALLVLLALLVGDTAAHADRLLPVVSENGMLTMYRWDDDRSGAFTLDYQISPCPYPYAVDINRIGLLVYVACISTGEVLELTPGPGITRVMASVPWGHPHDVLHNAFVIYVSSLHPGEITEIDRQILTMRRVVIGDHPDQLALSEDRSTLYATVLDTSSQVGRLVRVDTTSFAATPIVLAGAPPTEVFGGIAVSSDGRTLIVTGQKTERVYYIQNPATCNPCSYATQSVPDVTSGVAYDSVLGETWVPTFGDVHDLGRPLSFPMGVAYAPLLTHAAGDWLFVADWLNGTVEVFETLSIGMHQASINIGWFSKPRDLDLTDRLLQPMLRASPWGLSIIYATLKKPYTSPVRLTNIGAKDAHVGAAILEGPSVFEIVDGCKGKTLANDATCTIDVQCTPTASVAYTATVTVPSDGAEGRDVVTVVCRGK